MGVAGGEVAGTILGGHVKHAGSQCRGCEFESCTCHTKNTIGKEAKGCLPLSVTSHGCMNSDAVNRIIWYCQVGDVQRTYRSTVNRALFALDIFQSLLLGAVANACQVAPTRENR